MEAPQSKARKPHRADTRCRRERSYRGKQPHPKGNGTAGPCPPGPEPAVVQPVRVGAAGNPRGTPSSSGPRGAGGAHGAASHLAHLSPQLPPRPGAPSCPVPCPAPGLHQYAVPVLSRGSILPRSRALTSSRALPRSPRPVRPPRWCRPYRLPRVPAPRPAPLRSRPVPRRVPQAPAPLSRRGASPGERLLPGPCSRPRERIRLRPPLGTGPEQPRDSLIPPPPRNNPTWSSPKRSPINSPPQAEPPKTPSSKSTPKHPPRLRLPSVFINNHIPSAAP
ncbi:basic proline-rich protein-like [Pezoporus wallicus]|uniref:basic proline-rich protein-like n=1 Tax=Pezoporus wallicus TaxID=35540 RepID=UPI002550E347|nr:basic proline-rich protein-like [Pezoporus wallicus]